jgi:pre-mRNA-splicing factor 18
LRGFPITLFGETDWQRYTRLRHQEEHEPIEYIEGMDNEFAKEVRNVEESHEKRKDNDDFVMRPKLNDSLDSIVTIPDGRKSKDKEEFILILLKTYLSQWEQELNDRPDLEKRTAQGKVATATYNQCRKHIKPLFKLLRERVCMYTLTTIYYYHHRICMVYSHCNSNCQKTFLTR